MARNSLRRWDFQKARGGLYRAEPLETKRNAGRAVQPDEHRKEANITSYLHTRPLLLLCTIINTCQVILCKGRYSTRQSAPRLTTLGAWRRTSDSLQPQLPDY